MFRQIDVSEVKSVYSGKDGRCCCGCAGKHHYRPGFARDQYDSVNMAQVTRVLRLFAANPEAVEYDVEYPSHAALVLGSRLHIVYFTDEAMAARAAEAKAAQVAGLEYKFV